MTQDVLQNQTHANSRTVPLTATVVGGAVVISGDGSASLPRDSGAHRFDFSVASPPGLTVQFASLDTQDECSTCPPAPGDNSKQIVGTKIGKDGDTASFTNNNNNKDPMDVAYQWHFTCSDPSLQVQPFDPIINNGGTTKPPSS
jgi:hypothetical protein